MVYLLDSPFGNEYMNYPMQLHVLTYSFSVRKKLMRRVKKTGTAVLPLKACLRWMSLIENSDVNVPVHISVIWSVMGKDIKTDRQYMLRRQGYSLLLQKVMEIMSTGIEWESYYTTLVRISSYLCGVLYTEVYDIQKSSCICGGIY
jgi:hypothetical protein